MSAGLILANASPDALSVADGATITLRFLGPAATRPLHGLAWAGSHGASLVELLAAGKLVIDDAGLGGKTTEVYDSGGTTYVGLPAPAEAILVLP